MKSLKTNRFSAVLLSLGFIVHNNVLKVVGIDCVDSPMDLLHPGGNGTPFSCTNAFDSFGCTPHVTSHCPVTCDACDTLKCSDSIATISAGGTNFACSIIEGLEPDLISSVCENNAPKQTCRSLCEFCNIGINFDEKPFLDGGEEADYNYSNFNNYAYFSDEIIMENIGFYEGGVSPETGFSNGIVSGDNVAFNMFGDEARLLCPGGSFKITSMWATSAWLPNAPVVFEGTKSDATPVTFSTVLGSTKTPTYFEFSDFDDLINLSIDTSRDGDIVVMDDINIIITKQCEMPTSDAERTLKGRSHPGFPPIFPRHKWV